MRTIYARMRSALHRLGGVSLAVAVIGIMTLSAGASNAAPFSTVGMSTVGADPGSGADVKKTAYRYKGSEAYGKRYGKRGYKAERSSRRYVSKKAGRGWKKRYANSGQRYKKQRKATRAYGKTRTARDAKTRYAGQKLRYAQTKKRRTAKKTYRSAKKHRSGKKRYSGRKAGKRYAVAERLNSRPKIGLQSAETARLEKVRVAALGPQDFGISPSKKKSLTGGGVRWVASSGCLAPSLRAKVYQVASNFGRVTVSSTCRSAKRNRAVGGARRSQHLTGNAVDFRVHGNWRAAAAFLRGHGGGFKHYGGGLFHMDNGPRRRW